MLTKKRSDGVILRHGFRPLITTGNDQNVEEIVGFQLVERNIRQNSRLLGALQRLTTVFHRSNRHFDASPTQNLNERQGSTNDLRHSTHVQRDHHFTFFASVSEEEQGFFRAKHFLKSIELRGFLLDDTTVDGDDDESFPPIRNLDAHQRRSSEGRENIAEILHRTNE